MTSQDKIHILSRAVIIDQNHILLCTTLDLPRNFYFLPGGHIEHGESAEKALLRELEEETGAQCRIKRFLGILEHSFEPGHNSICHNHEYNLFFEVESVNLKRDNILKKCEKHIELSWIPLSQIGKIDLRAESLSKLIPEWLKDEVNNALKSQMI